jgi:cellobiose-specific phosphotransferase system component IIA
MIKKITDRIFPALIALSAFSVSASAAFYSISGLSKLFAGAAFAVIVMAASLEVAKLVIASLLYQYRKTLPLLLKGYLSIACAILILITSMGIYGFLSAAYQDTANKEGNAEARIVLIETKRDNIKEQLEVYTEEKASINEAVAELRKGLSNNKVQWRDKETGQIITSTSSRTRKALEKQLDQAIIRQTEINAKVDVLNEKIFEYETEIVETRIGDGSTSELGPLKYLSGLTGLPMDKIINYLLLTIIFVFDPLAIALVIAANFAFEKIRPKTKENLYGETVEIDEDEADRRMRVISQNGNDRLHYRDEIESEPAEEFDDDSQTINEKEEQIKKLEKLKQKTIKNDSTGKRTSEALANIDQQIKKLRDEDNTITY